MTLSAARWSARDLPEWNRPLPRRWRRPARPQRRTPRRVANDGTSTSSLVSRISLSWSSAVPMMAGAQFTTLQRRDGQAEVSIAHGCEGTGDSGGPLCGPSCRECAGSETARLQRLVRNRVPDRPVVLDVRGGSTGRTACIGQSGTGRARRHSNRMTGRPPLEMSGRGQRVGSQAGAASLRGRPTRIRHAEAHGARGRCGRAVRGTECRGRSPARMAPGAG